MENPVTSAEQGSTASRRSLGELVSAFSRRLRGLMSRLTPGRARPVDRELRYRTLFECVSDGFALVEAVRDAEGQLIDYVVLEANPALHKILRRDESVVGKRQAEALRNAPPGWMEACEAAFQGHAQAFEYHDVSTRRWFDIRLSRIAPDRIAQLVVDITDRKRAEAHQAELFDELNHRVKNNLAVVSAILSMQARGAPPEVREHLTKAVDRIKTIADVHASLYRSGRKDEVDFAAYLLDLCGRLGESVLDKTRVHLEFEAAPAVLPLDKAIALGVVVNELVTNAAKHAYPPPATGVISVKLVREGAELKLTIADDGPGLAAGPPRSGLGMRLVRSLVQQIGATLVVESEHGTRLIVHLPDAGGAAPSRQNAQTRLF